MSVFASNSRTTDTAVRSSSGVCRNGRRRNLELNDDRLIEADFEWGYEGAGPRRLAQAILNDFLGDKVDMLLSNGFLREVVAHLPSEFELTGAEVAAWVSGWRTSSGDARSDASA
jgi:hypothetical protein